jgi:nucleotide-binding universal stress UspA family protein
MLKKTLLPLSLEEPEGNLKDIAGFISQFGTETVSLLHVYSGSEEEKDRRESLLEKIAAIFRDRGMSTDTEIRSGAIAGEICKAASKREADYITIPWKKKNIIRRTILSSPDTDLLRICSYSTLIFKYREQGTRPGLKGGQRDDGGKKGTGNGDKFHMDTIVYATDCKRADKKVLPYLKSVPFGAKELHLLHVRERAPDPQSDRKRREELSDKMDKLAEQCLASYDNIEKVLLTGSVRRRIAGETRRRKADLLVIGRNDKEKPMDKLLGSTAESLPHQTHCSVLIIA